MRYFGFAVRFLVLPWGILFLPWGFWFCRDVFVFAVRFLVLLWQLWATIQNRPFAASHSRGTKQPRWRAKVALWQDICLLFVFSRCDLCSPAVFYPRECLAAKVLLGVYGRVWLANKWCHRYVRMRKIAQYVIQQTRELFVLTEVCFDIIPFVHNCSTSYLTKCSEPKEFYLSLHFCVFLELFRLLARVRARPWTTYFSHLLTVQRESTLRTRVAPMMFVFLLEKE